MAKPNDRRHSKTEYTVSMMKFSDKAQRAAELTAKISAHQDVEQRSRFSAQTTSAT